MLSLLHYLKQNVYGVLITRETTFKLVQKAYWCPQQTE
jgi:hypothetical protein